jgi:rod shape-determining protein MreC
MRGQQKYAAAAILTAAVCFLAFYVHSHRQGRTSYVDNVLIALTGSLQRQASYFVRGIKAVFDHYVFLVNAKKRSEDLERELEYLKTKLAALHEVEGENDRLIQALRFKDSLDETLLAAHVVAHDVSSDYFGIRIDRGSNDGVEKGMGVISPAGLVGRVLRVTPQHSDVMTLSDPNSNIDVVVQRSRARGVISGQSTQNSCKLRDLDRLEDVVVNDTIVSSGFGGVFPKGLLVGTVTAVIPNPSQVLQTVTVRTAVDIYRLEEVFIVFPREKSKKVS